MDITIIGGGISGLYLCYLLTLQKDFKNINAEALELERKTSLRTSDINMVEISIREDSDFINEHVEEQDQRKALSTQKQVNQIFQQTVHTEQMLQQERHDERVQQ